VRTNFWVGRIIRRRRRRRRRRRIKIRNRIKTISRPNSVLGDLINKIANLQQQNVIHQNASQ
jgi:hypothetical protein